MMNAAEHFRAGRLGDAITTQNEEVRSHPADIDRRSFLAELLCVAGNLDRADTQCETIERMDPGSGPGLNLLRQLIRAEKTRQEVHHQGRVPDLLVEAPDYVQSLLRALTALRAGDASQAAELANEAEEARPRLGGKCDGEPFEDFRDLDDLVCGVFEVLTSTGRYLWIPMRDVIELECDAPGRPLDLLWRPAMMSVRNGPEGKVYLPSIYAGRDAAMDDSARLGRSTDWVTEGDGGPTQGVGLRTFLVGEEAKTLFEFARIEFTEA